MCECGEGEENAGKGAGLELDDVCGPLKICDPIIVGSAYGLYVVKCCMNKALLLIIIILQ